MYSDSERDLWTKSTSATQRNPQGRLWLPESTVERVVLFGIHVGYVSVRLRAAKLEATQLRALPFPCGSGYLADTRGTSPSLLIIIDERVADHAVLRFRDTP